MLSGIELPFFDREDDARPARVILLNPTVNRTGHYWHVSVPGMQAGQLYGYRVHGPFDPIKGTRFDPAKVLLDPYDREVVVPKNYPRKAAQEKGDTCMTAMKSVIVDSRSYYWERVRPLSGHPPSRSCTNCMLKGFTRHPSSGVSMEACGTFRGLIEKIPYLKNLGISAVELLPIFQFERKSGTVS